MEVNIKQFYDTCIEKLKLREKLELLELLMQSTLELIRKEKGISESEVETNGEKEETESPEPPEVHLTDLQKLLLTGTVMDEEDYALFQEKKEHFSLFK